MVAVDKFFCLTVARTGTGCFGLSLAEIMYLKNILIDFVILFFFGCFVGIRDT